MNKEDVDLVRRYREIKNVVKSIKFSGFKGFGFRVWNHNYPDIPPIISYFLPYITINFDNKIYKYINNSENLFKKRAVKKIPIELKVAFNFMNNCEYSLIDDIDVSCIKYLNKLTKKKYGGYLGHRYKKGVHYEMYKYLAYPESGDRDYFYNPVEAQNFHDKTIDFMREHKIKKAEFSKILNIYLKDNSYYLKMFENSDLIFAGDKKHFIEQFY